VVADREAAFLRDPPLALLDLGVVELLDPAALHAHEVIVVARVVELEHRLARLEVMALQEPGLLELREHAIHRRQTDVEPVGHQQPIDVLGRQMPHRALLEELEDAQPRGGRLEADRLQVVGV
jgi:hypothetical protein